MESERRLRRWMLRMRRMDAFMTRGINDEEPRGGHDGEGHSLGECSVLFVTSKACKIQTSNGDEHLIPRSQIHDDSEIDGSKRGEVGKLVVTAWLARERGWIDADGEPAALKKPGRRWFGITLPEK